MVMDYEAFRLYMAVKLHFTSEKYDVFANNGRVKCHPNQFNARNDKILFGKLGARFTNPKDLIEYYVANFAYGHKNFIYEREPADDNYQIWLKRKETMNYEFSKQMQVLYNYIEQHGITYDQLFCIESGAPILMQLYLSKKINIETLVIINEFDNFLEQWESLILLWKEQLLLLNKIKRFVKYDRNRLQLTYHKHKSEILEIYHGTHQQI